MPSVARSQPVLAAAVAVAALLPLGIALRPGTPFLPPLTEDAFYSLTVARNLAAGLGPTVDGQLANGFQPLFTLVSAACFLLGASDAAAVRLVAAGGWVFHAGTAWLLALFARDAFAGAAGERTPRAAWAALLALAAPLFYDHAYNGLETGCVLFFYAVLARWVQTGRDRSAAGAGTLGLLLGGAILARIDAGLLAPALFVRVLLAGRRIGWRPALLRAALLTLAATAVSAPWWLYNRLLLGAFLPTSGIVQQEFALTALRTEFALSAVLTNLVPWLYLGTAEPAPLWSAMRLVLLLAALAALALARPRLDRRSAGFALCYAVLLAALFAYYTLGFTAYWFYYRYFAPFALPAIVAAAWLLARVTSRVLVPVAAGALTAQAAAVLAVIVGGTGFGGQHGYADQVALVRAHVPSDEYVAAGQSGTLGFMRQRVVNVDGKVNREAGVHRDRIWDYLRHRNVRWFADWPYYVNRYLGVPLDAEGLPASRGNGWRLVAERNYFYLYREELPADEDVGEAQ